MKVKKHSAGVVVMRRIKGEIRYLLLRCYGYWDFPKGEVEAGEEQVTTARREAKPD
jgi:bis(5'-nucleosidyl)-tetraphosphatase